MKTNHDEQRDRSPVVPKKQRRSALGTKTLELFSLATGAAEDILTVFKPVRYCRPRNATLEDSSQCSQENDDGKMPWKYTDVGTPRTPPPLKSSR